MTDVLIVLLILAFWIFLNRFVLPKLGVPT